jgi:hypothetical protein
MNSVAKLEHRASSSRSKHEGESSFGLCDRLSRTRDNSQRQLPTDQDYAVSTREYQTDQSSLKTAPTAARSVLDGRPKQRQQQTHRLRRLTRSLHIRASSSRSKHEGESSFGLCDRLSRTRDNSQRQLPTDQDYAVSTREYQTDQSSLKTAPTAARSVLDKRPKQRQQQTHRSRRLTRSLHIRPRPY